MVKDIILRFYKDNASDGNMFLEGRRKVFDSLIVDKRTDREMSDVDILAKPAPDIAVSYFIPGVVYLFLYPIEDGAIGKYRFIDYIPAVFCTGSERKSLHGINLNFLTPEKRAYFLNSIWNTDPQFYYDTVYTNKNTGFLNERLYSALSGNIQDFIRFESSYLKMDIRRAFRTYDMSRVSGTRMVGYYLWQYLPFFQMKESIKGADIETVQAAVCAGAELPSLSDERKIY